MLKSGFYLTFFNIVAALLGLVRNIAIARLVSVEDFGIASTFAIAMALIDMSANIGINRLIVQAKDGHSEEFQASLQGFQVVRGFFGGAFILVLAHPLADLFHTPRAVWAYQAMALLPIMKSFAHLDMARYQREHRFVPGVITETAAQAMSTLIAIMLGFWLRNYSAMLFALMGQTATYLIATQLFATRRYKIAWNPHYINQAVRFGWPLLLNGMLVFCIFQGDRLIIGNELGVTILGTYSLAYMFTLLPTGIIAKVIDTMCLPVLSRHQDDPEKFEKLANMSIEIGCLVGVLLALGFTFVGGPLLHLLYGFKHAAATDVLVLLAVMQAMRMIKSGPTIVAVSKKKTTNPMFANIVRGLFVPLTLIAIKYGYDIEYVVCIAIFGELSSSTASLLLLAQKIGVRAGKVLRTYISTLAMLSLCLLYEFMYHGEAFAISHWFGAIIVLAFILYALQLTELRTIVSRHLKCITMV